VHLSQSALSHQIRALEDHHGLALFERTRQGLQFTPAGERLLTLAGCDPAPVGDAHLCCGSAGTYSVLLPAIATRLRDNKLAALNAGGPEQVATANIGCLTHLQAGSALPVRHWIELIDEVLA
jgi:glycolate oxidase iron-sulfur subunit